MGTTLKDVILETEGTLQRVTAVLRIRGATFKLSALLAELKHTSHKDFAGEIQSQISTVFDQFDRFLIDIDPEQSRDIGGKLNEISGLILGENGAVDSVFAYLLKKEELPFSPKMRTIGFSIKRDRNARDFDKIVLSFSIKLMAIGLTAVLRKRVKLYFFLELVGSSTDWI